MSYTASLAKIASFREDGDKILTLVDEGKALVPFLTQSRGVCEFIENDVKLGEMLGSGINGKVYQLILPGKRLSEYVVKRVEVYKLIYVQNGETPIEALQRENIFIPSDDYLTLISMINKGRDLEESAKRAFNLKIPDNTECLLDETKEFRNNARNTKFRIPKGNYLCENQTYNEYLLSLIVSEFYNSGECINFLETFGFGSCLKTRKKTASAYSYMFIEKIDDTLHQMLKYFEKGDYELGDNNFAKYFPKRKSKNYKLPKVIELNILFQIFFAILVYQESFNISHNDLHDANIFVKYIRKGDTYNGQNLNVDYFSYVFNDRTYYIPFVPFIIKIGDWEYGVKWDLPIIGNKKIIKGKMGDAIPSIFFPMYDPLRIVGSIEKDGGHGMQCHLIFVKWLLQKEILTEEDYNLFVTKTMDGKDKLYFPSIELVNNSEISTLRMRNFFEDGMWDALLKPPPPGSKIVLLGSYYDPSD